MKEKNTNDKIDALSNVVNHTDKNIKRKKTDIKLDKRDDRYNKRLNKLKKSKSKESDISKRNKLEKTELSIKKRKQTFDKKDIKEEIKRYREDKKFEKENQLVQIQIDRTTKSQKLFYEKFVKEYKSIERRDVELQKIKEETILTTKYKKKKFKGAKSTLGIIGSILLEPYKTMLSSLPFIEEVGDLVKSVKEKKAEREVFNQQQLEEEKGFKKQQSEIAEKRISELPKLSDTSNQPFITKDIPVKITKQNNILREIINTNNTGFDNLLLALISGSNAKIKNLKLKGSLQTKFIKRSDKAGKSGVIQQQQEEQQEQDSGVFDIVDKVLNIVDIASTVWSVGKWVVRGGSKLFLPATVAMTAYELYSNAPSIYNYFADTPLEEQREIEETKKLTERVKKHLLPYANKYRKLYLYAQRRNDLTEFNSLLKQRHDIVNFVIKTYGTYVGAMFMADGFNAHEFIEYRIHVPEKGADSQWAYQKYRYHIQPNNTVDNINRLREKTGILKYDKNKIDSKQIKKLLFSFLTKEEWTRYLTLRFGEAGRQYFKYWSEKEYSPFDMSDPKRKKIIEGWRKKHGIKKGQKTKIKREYSLEERDFSEPNSIEAKRHGGWLGKKGAEFYMGGEAGTELVLDKSSTKTFFKALKLAKQLDNKNNIDIDSDMYNKLEKEIKLLSSNTTKYNKTFNMVLNSMDTIKEL